MGRSELVVLEPRDEVRILEVAEVPVEPAALWKEMVMLTEVDRQTDAPLARGAKLRRRSGGKCRKRNAKRLTWCGVRACSAWKLPIYFMFRARR